MGKKEFEELMSKLLASVEEAKKVAEQSFQLQCMVYELTNGISKVSTK